MAVNKVETRKGNEVTVLMDLTSDTVTPEGLLEGLTAHGADGKLITGTLGQATDDKKGIAKLYSGVGANTDGAVAQNAVTDLLSGRTPVLASDTAESYSKETPYPYAVVNSIGGKCVVVDDSIAFAEVEQVITDKAIYPIPEAIRQLEGYGWSAGDMYNEVDYKNKKFIKRVGRVDLGACTWIRTSTDAANIYRQRTESVKDAKPCENNEIGNVTCALYDAVVAGTPGTYGRNKGISINTVGQVIIYDEAYNAADSTEAFQSAMAGVYMYYELAETIITDLSNILTSDFLVECEAGGTMTFENSAGFAVPSDIEFVTESNYTKRLVEKYAKGGGGITVIDGTDSVIIKAENAPLIIGTYTELQDVEGTKIGYTNPDNKIVANGLILPYTGTETLDDETIYHGADITFPEDSPLYYSYGNSPYNCTRYYARINSETLTSATIGFVAVHEDGTETPDGSVTTSDTSSVGITFRWKDILPPNSVTGGKTFPYGYVTVQPFRRYKNTSGVRTSSASGTMGRFVMPFKSLDEYNAAIGLTRSVVTALEAVGVEETTDV